MVETRGNRFEQGGKRVVKDMMFLVFRSFFITMMTIGMMASLTEFRFKRKKQLLILSAYGFWVIVSSMGLLWFGGELLLLRLFYLTISVPAILLTYWAANDTPAQAVFNYTTQIMVSILMASVIRWLTEAHGFSGIVNLMMMGGVYLVIIYLEWRFIRKPFRMMIQMIPDRWGVLTLIPCVFCGYLIFVAAWPGSYLENMVQRIYLYTAVIPLIFVYIAVFRSMMVQYRIQMEKHNAVLLTVQIAALKEKLQRVKEVEEGIRIQRHDLRHQLQAVTELIVREDKKAALEFLEAEQKRLDEYQEIRWCHPPVMDAVFSSYFNQARNHGISVKANISLPDILPVDEGELALVLANALENSIHANMELPEDRREIRCRMIGTPSIILDISNPCDVPVFFDKQGLPITQKENHGLGVKSIAAFCEKHEAVYQFEVIDHWFRMRIIL